MSGTGQGANKPRYTYVALVEMQAKFIVEKRWVDGDGDERVEVLGAGVVPAIFRSEVHHTGVEKRARRGNIVRDACREIAWDIAGTGEGAHELVDMWEYVAEGVEDVIANDGLTLEVVDTGVGVLLGMDGKPMLKRGEVQ